MNEHTLNQPHRIVNNIHTMSAGDFKNILLPPWLGVVYEIVRASIFLNGIELRL